MRPGTQPPSRGRGALCRPCACLVAFRIPQAMRPAFTRRISSIEPASRSPPITLRTRGFARPALGRSSSPFGGDAG